MSDEPNSNQGTITSASARPKVSDFERAAREDKGMTIVGEVLFMLKTNKKWWLLPILLAIAIITVLVGLGATPLSPFLYPLF